MELDFKTLYHYAPCGYLYAKEDGTLIEVNNTFLTLTGYAREEIIATKRFEDFLAIGGKIYYETHFVPLLQMQGEVSQINFDFIRKDGTRFPVLINALKQSANEKQPGHIQFIVLDITQRKQYEMELMTAKRESEELLTQLLEAKKELLHLNEWLEDRAARTEEHLRQAKTELIEGEKLTLIGRLFAGVAHELNTPLGAISASASNLTDTLSQLFQIDMTNEERDVLFNAFRLSETFSSLSTLSSRDERAERKRLEIHLASKYGVLSEAAYQARMLIDCGVTAEDHNALNLIYSSSDPNAALELVTSILRANRSIRTISIASVNAANVIRALKSYVRNDAGDSATVFDARRSINNVLLLFNSQMKRGVQLHTDMPYDLPILGNETEVSKIWGNLISNAIYAMDYRGNLWITGKADDTTVTIYFSNDGPQIPDEVRARLFEPFYTTKPIGEGSGMGLSIISNILAALHGSIQLESEQITTFTITLPKAIAD